MHAITILFALVALISLILNVYQFAKSRERNAIGDSLLESLAKGAGNFAADCREGKIESIEEVGRQAKELSNLTRAIKAFNKII